MYNMPSMQKYLHNKKKNIMQTAERYLKAQPMLDEV